MGIAIIQDNNTSITNSVESKRQRLPTLAPNTFLMPISLVRCPATKLAIPNKTKTGYKYGEDSKIGRKLADTFFRAEF